MIRNGFYRCMTALSLALLGVAMSATMLAQNSQAGQRTPPGQNGLGGPQANALEQLLSGRGRALEGQPVTLSNVAIQQITGDDIVWVGTSPQNSVMVMLRPSVNPIDAWGNPTPVAVGDVVSVTGHVVPAPSAKELESWGVSPADAARVQRQGVVVQASVFELTKKRR